MTKDFQDFLTRFVNSYEGKKLSFLMAGGGGSAALLSVVPGSSKVLHDVRILYSEESTLEYYNPTKWSKTMPKFVSETMVEGLYITHRNLEQGKSISIVTTSALTTSRHRKGDNLAYICVFGSCWELQFDKLPESVYEDTCIPWRDQKIANKRQAEDELLVTVAIKLATGFEHDTLEDLKRSKTLRKLS